MRLWVPSQKGLFTEPPQRQREKAEKSKNWRFQRLEGVSAAGHKRGV